ncbi:MAG: cell division protein FtsZ, partial [Pseudomonadota bacterium]
MMNLKVPENIILKPTITVFGVGGAGGNAIKNMIASNLQGVVFVDANTDAQALEYSVAEHKIQLGATVTRGLGAGAAREVGMAAAEESRDDIISHLEGSNMVFITAGMGGGTGTGAAPVVARIAKELGILTVGVVTKPFHFEGAHRMKTADAGLIELQQYVDTLIVIPNQNLFRIANEKTTFVEAFRTADEVLKKGVQSITDLMIMPGLINLDFADISAVMSKMGKAMMGTGEATGEDRAVRAAEMAIQNPLLDQSSMKGARGVLINITGGDMTLMEVDAAANRIREEVGNSDANIIFGSTFDEKLEGIIRVSVVATGIDSHPLQSVSAQKPHVVTRSFADTLSMTPKKEEAVSESSIPEESIASFNEYDMPDSGLFSSSDNLGRSDNTGGAGAERDLESIQPQPHPQSHQYEVTAPHQPVKQAKPSLFGRFWESITGSEDKSQSENND